MKKSEHIQIIKEEIKKTPNLNEESNPQHIYDNLLRSYNKTAEWLTQNASTAQSVEIKRAFSVAFEKLQNVLLKSNRSRNFSLNENPNLDMINRSLNLLDKAADMAIKNPTGDVTVLAKIIKKYVEAARKEL